MRETLVKTEEFKDSPVGRIPKDWDVKPLSELADVDRGKFTHRPRNDPRFYGGSYPFIQTGDIANSSGGILSTYSQTLNERGITVSREFPVGTIAITIAANIADTAILGIPMFFPDSVVGAVVKKPNSIRYVELCIRRAKQRLDARAPQSAQKNINLEDLRPLLIPVPSPEEQHKIAEVIDTIEEAIAHTSSLIAKLKQMKAGLLHDLLTRGLDENGELRDAIAHPEQFKDSALGQIPKDWEVVPIQQAATQVPGATTIGPFGSNLLASDYRSVGVPVTFVRDIKADGFEWNSNIYVEPKKARELSAHSVQSGDLLATKMGLPPCIACVYPEWMASGIITADIIRLRPNTQISTSQWLSLFVNSHAVIRQVRGITGGITRDKITLHDFRELLIALPSLKEQKQITNILDTYNSRIGYEEAYREKLKLQKQGLMHDLLTGKVRVKNA